jgi:alkaline phosphatase
MNADAAGLDYLFGLFNNDHLEFHLQSAASDEPTLLQMTSKAMQVLSDKSERGYVLVVEGGRIDQGHHRTMAHLAIDETVEFHKAVEYARANVDIGETLIVVTADHSNTLTVGGYPVGY